MTRPADRPPGPPFSAPPTRFLWGPIARRGRVKRVLSRVLWGLQAGTWDRYLELPEYAERNAVVLEWFSGLLSGGGRRLLDVGCGTGSAAVALASAGFGVVGVDSARGMLRRARRAARGARTGSLDFRRADVDDGLPFPAGSFDGVLCVAALHVATDPGALLTEIRRVLRPGGFLALVLGGGVRPPPPGSRIGRLLWRMRQVLRTDRRSRSPRPIMRYARPELLDLLHRAGFDRVDERGVGRGLALLLRARGRDA